MVSLCVTYFSKIWRDNSMQFIHIKQRNKYHNAILSSLSLENIHSIIQLHQVTFYPSICSWKLTKSCYTIGTPLAWIEPYIYVCVFSINAICRWNMYTSRPKTIIFDNVPLYHLYVSHPGNDKQVSMFLQTNPGIIENWLCWHPC